MATPGDDGLPVGSLADDTGERYILEHGLVVIVVAPVPCRLAPVRVRDDGALDFLAFRDGFPFAVELPSLLVVASVVKKFAIIPVAAKPPDR